MTEFSAPASPLVLIAGATSASGVATGQALTKAGAKVVGVGSNQERLAAFEDRVPGSSTYRANLDDEEAVNVLADTVRADHGSLDGLLVLVGGWRGGGGIPGQSEEDWGVLSRGFAALRNTSRVFYDDLAASLAGRLAIVSSHAVDGPTAGVATYAAAKAAAETWVRAVAEGFARDQSKSTHAPAVQRSAAVVFVVRALVDDSMRAADPTKSFDGYTDVTRLADHFVELWTADASALNGERIIL
jgi:3-oxoacyl-[acyl-carrier protein] reductase